MTLTTSHVFDPLKDALCDLAQVFGDGMTADMVGGHFTCSEANKIAGVLKLSGHTDAAVTWLQGHAMGDDDPDDDHRDLADLKLGQTPETLAAAIKYVADEI
jgi:hypothetical protein